MYPIKQSTALTVLIFAHDVNGDALTGKVDGNWTKRISKGAGTFAAMTVTITELENGWYSVPLTTTHTDTLGILSMTFTASGVKQINLQYKVTAREYDDLATSSALTTLQADTDDIQTRLPAALVSGRIDASVGAMAANVLTATAINADAITAAKIADAAIDAATFAAGAINAAAIATDAITAAKIAADAIGASELAADAVTEIQAAIAAGAVASVTGSVGSIATGGITRASFAADTGLQTIRSGTAQAGAATTITLDASASAVDNFYSDAIVLLTVATGAGQARRIVSYVGSTKVATIAPAWATNPDVTSTFAILPRAQVIVGALVANAIDATVLATDAFTNAELAASAVNEIRDAILSDSTPFAGANINATISSRATPAQVNTEVLDVLTVDTFAELAAVPAATSTLKDKLNWLFALARNKITQTSTTQTLRNDADSGTIAASTVSDDATTFIRGEFT